MSDDTTDELNADRLTGLFDELSGRLAQAGEHAQLFVVGGAAMALAYDGTRVTRDVDALFEPTGAVRQAAADMSAAHGLEPDWLNDAVKGFLPGDAQDTRTVFESEHLLVQVPSPEYLLAMKMHAARDDRDLDDAATLFNAAGLTTADQGRELLERTYPDTLLLPRHQYLPDEVAARAASHREDPSHPTGSTPADEIQRYAAATRHARQHDTVGPDDAARLAAGIESERVARQEQTAQRGTVAAAAEQERAEQVRQQLQASDAQRQQEQQRRGLCP